MANRYSDPDIQYCDGTGAPLAGAQLFFYATGTSTKQSTYSDSALSIANANPIVLDSNGRAGSVWLQNLKYKVVLAPSTDTDPPTSPIWTQDPVYASDVSTVAQVQGTNGSPNGQLAGTQGSSGIPASMAWDYTNDILYVCTTTGNAAAAVWTAINAATAAAVVPAPQGRLTLTSQTPILATDTTMATVVYYTPYVGLVVPIYNGSSMVPTSIIAEQNITLQAAHVANNIYDLYEFLLSGVPTLGTGPSWSAGTGGSITAGSCARGTLSGGAALTKISGIWTNAVSMTMTYGSGGSTTTVAANQGTYLGSMYVDGTNGQVSCYLSSGQSRKWGIWNAYNRARLILQVNDSTASWNYNTATFQQSNANTGNTLTTFSGLPEEALSISFTQKAEVAYNNSNAVTATIGIGFNSTTSASGIVSLLGASQSSATSITDTMIAMAKALYEAPPSLGINNVNAINQGSAAGTSTFFGGANMLLRAEWRG